MVKREHTSSDEEGEDEIATPPSTPKRSPKIKKEPSTPKTPKTPKPPKSPKTSKVKNEGTPGTPGKKMGAWSKDELQTLYAIMNPKRTGVKWDEVADQIPGRDNKSCQNKWSRMQAKIMEAIGAMGE